MPFLAPPQGPGLIVGAGTRKLLAAVERMRARRAGAVSAYKRDPATEDGLPSWVVGDPADPDGRISVTADGLLEVTKTTREQPRAAKGKPPSPPKVTRVTALVDLQNTKIELKPDEHVEDRFLSESRRAVERELQARVLDTLSKSTTRVSDGETDADNMTLGAFVKEVTSGTYTQVSYYGKGADKRQSELLKQVLAAFNQLRKGVPKEEKAAHTAAIAAATERKRVADRAATAAQTVLNERKATLKPLADQRETFYRTIAWILDPAADPEKRASMSVGGLCNVITFFLYGKAVGVIPAETDFQDYYLAEVKAARIRYHKGDEHEGVLWGEGSLLWAQQRDLVRFEDPDLATNRDAPQDPMTHPSRRAELDAFLRSGVNVALSHQDLQEPPKGEPHHFLFIVKVDGVWRNMDHTASSFLRRGAMTDWNRVYRVEVDASLMRAAMQPAPAAAARPAGGMPLQ